MRLFSGLSFGGRRLRAGVSFSGRPWLGARAGKGAGYVGVRSGGGSSSRSSSAEGHPILAFTIDDDGRVFLGDAELELDSLREVVAEATLRRNAKVPNTNREGGSR